MTTPTNPIAAQVLPWNGARLSRPSPRRQLEPMHVNKVSHIKPVDLVAKELGEDVDTLYDVALGMEHEDGLIWVHGLDEKGVIAFTGFGVESLVELLQIHREQEPSKR